MDVAFRKIDRQLRWETPDWLPDDEASADAVTDLRTSSNKLSIYFVDQISVDRLIAALAATRKDLDHLDYLLVPRSKFMEAVAQSGVTLEESSDGTGDAVANEWHRDLVRLTGTKLVQVAACLQHNSERQRCHFKRIGALIVSAVKQGWIPIAAVNENLLGPLRKRGFELPSE